MRGIAGLAAHLPKSTGLKLGLAGGALAGGALLATQVLARETPLIDGELDVERPSSAPPRESETPIQPLAPQIPEPQDLPAIDQHHLRHILQEGETLWQLEMQYGVPWEEIAQLNQIDDHTAIPAGTVLALGYGPLERPAAEVTYIVTPSDSLSRIASFFCVPVEELAAHNGIDDPSTIHAGQRIVIPAPQATEPAQPAPTTAPSTAPTTAPTPDPTPEPTPVPTPTPTPTPAPTAPPAPQLPAYLTASTPPAPTNPADPTQLDNVRTVAWVAHQFGMDPLIAIAVMLQESMGDEKAVGDGGHSWGLFQLNNPWGKGAGMTQQQAFDPETNARRALDEMAKIAKAKPHLSPGEIGLAAQRAGDPHYIEHVNGRVDMARDLLKQAAG